MAAHILTALNDIASHDHGPNNTAFWKQLDAALNLSCWTEDLDYDDYAELARISRTMDDIALNNFITYALAKYSQVFAALRFPQNRETWNQRRFADA